MAQHSRRLTLAVLAALAVSILQCACSSTGQKAASDVDRVVRAMELDVLAVTNLNPDSRGRAAPLLVRVYELRTDEGFRQADFFDLQLRDRKILGDEMVVRDEFVMMPGESKSIHRKIDGETRFIAVLAGYRQLESAVWRHVHALAVAPEAAWYRTLLPVNKVRLRLELRDNELSLNEPQ